MARIVGYVFLFLFVSVSHCFSADLRAECKDLDISSLRENFKILSDARLAKRTLTDDTNWRFPLGVFASGPVELSSAINWAARQYMDNDFVQINYQEVGQSNIMFVFVESARDLDVGSPWYVATGRDVKWMFTQHALINGMNADANAISEQVSRVLLALKQAAQYGTVAQFSYKDQSQTILRIVAVFAKADEKTITLTRYNFLELVGAGLGVEHFPQYRGTFRDGADSDSKGVAPTPLDKWMMRAFFASAVDTQRGIQRIAEYCHLQ
jgi:hypothetical protein